MSGPSNRVAVISPRFCVEYPVELTITRKLMTLSEGTFEVTDSNENVMFRVQGGELFSLQDCRVLLDSHGKPLITLQQKLLSAHRRWQVFRGESTDEKDMVFNVKKSSHFQLKTELDVVLASNTNQDACDFKIENSWFEMSCVIYAANSNKIIARMEKVQTASSLFFGKDTFGVTVYPNVDYAFIVALVVILEEINEDR